MIKQHLTVSKDNRKRVYRQADTPRSLRLDIDGNNQRGMKIVVHRTARGGPV